MRKQSAFAVLVFIIIFALGAALTCCVFWVWGNPYTVWVGLAASFIISSLAFSATKVANQWDRCIVLRLDKFHALKGPGFFFHHPYY
jgi:regulator of protease activity HflC (stomatin/prohibitin superfamily)